MSVFLYALHLPSSHLYLGPLLLGHGVESDDEHHPKLREDWKQLPSHDDEDQVRLDVDRSFIYYPNGTTLTDVSRLASDHLHRPIIISAQHQEGRAVRLDYRNPPTPTLPALLPRLP